MANHKTRPYSASFAVKRLFVRDSAELPARHGQRVPRHVKACLAEYFGEGKTMRSVRTQRLARRFWVQSAMGILSRSAFWGLAGILAAQTTAPLPLEAAQPQYAPYGANSPGYAEPDLRAAVGQIFDLANQARAQAGVATLAWDTALAAAALQHCRMMAAAGPISHQYRGEPELSSRAAQAGAHFSVIEENVAFAPSAAAVHQAWMQSPGHRANLLSPDVDHVGIALVYARGELYAVADYSRAAEQMSATQVEARVAALIRASGVAILGDPSVARAACAGDSGMPRTAGGAMPRFIMRWQDADLTRLPQALKEKLASGNYRQAAVGSCPAQIDEGAFTAYRVVVLLY